MEGRWPVRGRSKRPSCVLGVCGVGSTGVVGCADFAVNLQPVCEKKTFCL